MSDWIIKSSAERRGIFLQMVEEWEAASGTSDLDNLPFGYTPQRKRAKPAPFGRQEVREGLLRMAEAYEAGASSSNLNRPIKTGLYAA